ncbi:MULTISPECIES: response regulator [unclassified Pseudomonas]|uniref:response regulator n=1 Tax=unclassified Pseudomonas TaxID=196821 RepID=UPI001C483768|nr:MULTISPECIES: response regulator [unclassified Pseudomonas]
MATQRIAEGRRVLVVEDEMTIALMVEEMLLDLGAEVIGPESRLDAALRLASEASLDAAILDVNIRGGNSYPVADILAKREFHSFSAADITTGRSKSGIATARV